MEILGIAIIVLVAFLINGAISKVEDDSPGGFENPDGKWIDSIRNPTKTQVVVWCSGLITVGWLIYMLLLR
jgi:hypothetical protein